jgi:hypothetical protein
MQLLKTGNHRTNQNPEKHAGGAASDLHGSTLRHIWNDVGFFRIKKLDVE